MRHTFLRLVGKGKYRLLKPLSPDAVKRYKLQKPQLDQPPFGKTPTRLPLQYYCYELNLKPCFTSLNMSLCFKSGVKRNDYPVLLHHQPKLNPFAASNDDNRPDEQI